MDYKNRCRTCLGSEKEMCKIHSSVRIAGEDVHLTDVLMNFYHYKVTSDPQFPEEICINCVYQLTITYSFKVLIESSSQTLSDNLNILESNDDNYDCNYESDNQQPKNIKKVKKSFKALTDSNTETLSDNLNILESNDDNYDRNYESEGQKPTHFKKVKRKKTNENNGSFLYCVECKAKFQSVKFLIEHCNSYHSHHQSAKSNIGRVCEYCNEKLEDFRSLILHKKRHLKPYVCENCWAGFYSVDKLSSHSCESNDKEQENKTCRQCDQCGKSYTPGYIRIHMMTHSNERAYSCKYCPKKFKVPCSLNSHVLWNHKRTRNHKCEVCNATFISSSSRSSHIRKHHLKEKKYGCDTCGKRFFSKTDLRGHSLTHTGVKNFHCHLCNKSYQARHGLKVHLKSHSHNATDVLN